jgi:hypothetical protein
VREKLSEGDVESVTDPRIEEIAMRTLYGRRLNWLSIADMSHPEISNFMM